MSNNVKQTFLERVKNGYIPEKKQSYEFFAYTYINEEMNKPKNPSGDVTNFLKGKNILLTGGTGFLGKLVIEKLLRSCKDINTIYLIARPKRGVQCNDRIEKLLEDDVFGKLKESYPDFKKKIVCINGDIGLPHLGLSEEDRRIIVEKVNIIYHGAATTKFNEHIRKAVAINIKGTEELLKIAKECKELKSFVHISTAFSNCNQKVIEEKVYKPSMKVDEIYGLVEAHSDEDLEEMTPKIIGTLPNTYTFTKQIAEHLVLKLGSNLPVCIVRPSMVTCTYNEPVRGWIDNFYGPMGAIAAVGIGLMHTMYMNRECNADLVPADYVVNACIVASFKNTFKTKSGVPVYNFVSSTRKNLTYGRMVDNMTIIGRHLSSVNLLWYPFLASTKSYILYRILFYILHIVPAFFVDIALRIKGKKPMMVQTYKKVEAYSLAIMYFSNTDWKFEDNNTKDLHQWLSKNDRKNFNFDIENVDWWEYCIFACYGTRVYLLKDPLNTLEDGWKKMDNRRFWHKTVSSIFIILFFYIVLRLLK